MTQFYYLTAKIPLETGFFGQQERRSRKGIRYGQALMRLGFIL